MTIEKSEPKSKLEKFYAFFQTYGTERLNGLGESYFADLNPNEKEEAWSYLLDGFSLSSERVIGLYHLDKFRAVPVFKEAISHLMAQSPYPAEQQAIELNRLLMIQFINTVEPDEKYLSAMCEFARSEFEDVRAEFAQSLPIHRLTRGTVEALKGIIFTETETIPLSSAVMKLMLIHGLDFDSKDPVYKSIYLALSSDDPKEKLAAMNRLEQNHLPDYIS